MQGIIKSTILNNQYIHNIVRNALKYLTVLQFGSHIILAFSQYLGAICDAYACTHGTDRHTQRFLCLLLEKAYVA